MDKKIFLKEIIRDIENLGIEITFNDNLPIDAVTNVKRKLMTINLKNSSIFKLAHEKSHVENDDQHRFFENDSCCVQEIRANRDAIIYLWDKFLENGGNYDYFSLFVETTSCPFYMAYDIISKQYQEQEGELNQFDSFREVDDDELQRCIEEYICSLDVVDEINIYGFLEVYHLAYNLYEKATEIFHEIIVGNDYQTA